MNPRMGLALRTRREASVVGLDIEAASVAATEVVSNGSVQLSRSGIAELPPGATRDGEVGDAEVLAATIKELFAEHKLGRSVRLGLANQRVVVRTMRLPFIEDREELGAAIRFQAQEELAMPLEQSVFDWQALSVDPALRAEGKVDVVAVAARREMVTALVEVVRQAGLRPVGIDVSAFGLIRALGKGSADEPAPAWDPDGGVEGGEGVVGAPAKLLCCLGDSTNLAVARDGDCLFARVSTFGLEGIAQRLSEQRELTLAHSRQWLRHVGVEAPVEEIEGDPEIVASAREVLNGGVMKLADEMRLSLDYYGAQDGAVAIDEVVICGPTAVIPGVPGLLERELGYQIRVGRPAALEGLDDVEAARLALPFGIALEQ